MGLEPVGYVAFVGQVGEFDYADGFGDPVEVLADLLGVFPSWGVVVGEDDDVGACEPAVEVFCPFAGSADVAGGGDAVPGESVGVFFAFDDVDGVARFVGGDDVR